MLIPSSVLNPGNKYITSIQQIQLSFAGTASATKTINVVGSNAFIIFLGFTGSGTGQSATGAPKVVLTNSTTVTATTNSATNAIVDCVVIDPTSALVTGVQAGTITITAGTSNTATISSVDTTKSAVFYLGNTSTSGFFAEWNSPSAVRLALTNATTVTASLGSTGTVTVSYVVVTFAAAALQSSVQQFSTTKSTGTSNTQTITSVTAANAMIAWGGLTNTDSTTAGFSFIPWITLTNGTTVTLTSNAAAHYTCNFTVIEFVPGVLNSVQRGSIALSSQSSKQITITSVNAAKAFCGFLGQTGAGTTNGTTNTKVLLTTATTISTSVNTAASPTTGYEVIEFAN